jgi:hypothetical protein
MISHLFPFVMVWSVLAAVVLGLILWRKVISAEEDDTLHISETGAVQKQVSVAHRLEMIDKWGKLLTVIVVVSGLILAGVYLYHFWVASSSFGV